MTVAASDTRVDIEPMATDVATQVTAFARACKAAARTVALYPSEHPAVGAALDVVTAAGNAAASSTTLRIAVLPDTLTVDGRSMARPDASVAEFAALLHAHQVGQLAVHPLTDSDLWRRFLALVALPPDQARLRGGLGQLWASEGQPRIEVRSLDYRELLRSHLHGDRATWESIVSACLDGDATGIDDNIVELLFGVLDDPSKVAALVGAMGVASDGAADGTGAPSATGAGGGRSPLVVAGLLQAVARYVETTQGDRFDQAMSALAEAAGQLPVPVLQPIVRAGLSGSRAELTRFVKDLAARMADGTLADLVANEIRGGRGATRQLADAFCGLAPDPDRRSAILTLARSKLTPEGTPASVPLEPAMTQAWKDSSQLLLTYSDEMYVSDGYHVELSNLAERAVDLDRDQTDPPDVIAEWRRSVLDDRIRGLDVELIVDLLQLQSDAAKWRPMAELAISRMNMLLVTGDFNAAACLIEAIGRHAAGHPDPAVREAAGATMTSILTPVMMRHVADHLDTADRNVVDAARRLCQALGTGIVYPLADVLSREERTRPRQHLITFLIGFGSSGRQAVERLRHSPNAAVRRTAVLLLREFGGHDALTDLESLLNDSEINVQREATLAIAMMGIEPAFEALVRGLSRGSARSSNTIMGVVSTMADDEAQPMLAYVVQHAPLRGALWTIHERAIVRLGGIGGPRSTLALSAALERQKIWAPFRTRALHRLALAALARVNLPDAWRTIEEAAAHGPRYRRSAAKALLGSRPAAEETPQA